MYGLITSNTSRWFWLTLALLSSVVIADASLRAVSMMAKSRNPHSQRIVCATAMLFFKVSMSNMSITTPAITVDMIQAARPF
ncbi:hypothetical protein D3C81_1857530 [compost metagenome]